MHFLAPTYRKDLWAITCYFNPMRYRRRSENYRIFRRQLSLPLVAVELASGREFELNDYDAEILIKLSSTDVLWQKERLLNVALEALPSTCRKVLWIDCDVVFGTNDWAERTSWLLDHFRLVQPFSHVYDMPSNWQPGDGRPPGTLSRCSIPFLLASGMPIAACLGSVTKNIGSAPGYAWAAPREILAQYGLYDACVVGGGDSAIIRAAYGCFHEAVEFHHMNNRRKHHYLSWAVPFHKAVQGKISFLDGDLMHLWHGRLEDRQYFARVHEFERFNFDPFDDIAVDPNGAWRWSSDKREMHDYVRAYLASRKEDG